MNKRTVTVAFPDGDREVEPVSWTRQHGFPNVANFDIPGYRVIQTCAGGYIAVTDTQEIIR